jgi:signal transduction histidine kinase
MTPRLPARPQPRSLARLPPRTLRLRLTFLYGALFLASGAVLLAITYLLFRNATGVSVLIKNGSPPKQLTTQGGISHFLSSPHSVEQLPPAARQGQALAAREHATALHQLLIQSGIALAIMAGVSMVLGWLVAGRVLRPLRTMTATTRRISARNLHERLAIGGPRDELRDLADTVDGLLERLEGAFGAQRRFVANAAHELRTPLTLLHALLEETLTDRSATIDSFRATSRRLLALGEEQERLLESLLTLASSERGLDQREPFDLAAVAEIVLRDPHPETAHSGVQIDSNIHAAPTTGDAALAERLVSNLIDNAVRHNIPDGRVQINTGTKDGRAFVTVTNTGPVIPAAEVERLFEPFHRLGADRTARSDGHHGLGLSIVRAIATAHHATILAEARPHGGLVIGCTPERPARHARRRQAPESYRRHPGDRAGRVSRPRSAQ